MGRRIDKDNPYRIGDWVTVIGTDGDGTCFRETYANRHKIPYDDLPKTFRVGYVSHDFVCEGDKDIGDGTFLPRLRYATPQEITAVGGYSNDYQIF
jgi:hypothetical protein